ncbi:MAG: DNA recombination/repair protein RecA, partial [Candidatus Calescibacterium sp.]|nr:DNA recombination/repair protein RecA [Candidatus Calescibacterium sp.]
LQARLMSQALRRLTSIVGKSKTAVIFINQIREKVGVIFGNPETTPGGRALKFYASVRIELRKIDNIKKGEVSIGARVKAKIVKNKVAPPFKETHFNIIFGKGIDRIGEVADIATDMNIISKSGSWYSFGDEKIGQGRDKLIEYLESNPNLYQEIEKKVLESLNI